MSNHFHVLLEVPPMPEGGISDQELLLRLGVFYSEAQVAEIVREMEQAASVRTRGEFELAPEDAMGLPLTPAQEMAVAKQQAARRLEEIRRRYTRRMHDLSEFMKSLLERFTKWFNRTHSRSGTLWEDRFKSVIVESGVAARTMAAFRPTFLANHVLELARAFHSFYEARPALQADEPIRPSHLANCELTSRSLKRALNLLGIDVPERM